MESRDLIAMRGELEEMLGRKVDLVEKNAIRNPFRRREILRTLQVVCSLRSGTPVFLRSASGGC